MPNYVMNTVYMIKLTDFSFNIPDWQAQFRLAFCQ